MATLYDNIMGLQGDPSRPGPVDPRVSSLYEAMFNRPPDVPGGTFWTNALKNGETMPQLQQDFYLSQENQDNRKFKTFPVTRQATPVTQDQQNWMDNARSQSANLNKMPFVLDPGSLTSDPASNKNLMYPAQLQPSGVSQVIAGGKNIGPDLSAKGIDASQVPTSPSDLAAYVAQKTGMSQTDALTWLQGLMGSTAASGAGGSPTLTPDQMATPYQPNPNDF